MNPTFLYDASKFTGVAWFPAETYKQCAMVTPRHFLWATHYGMPTGKTIRFIDTNGVVVDRTVSAATIVPGHLGGNSDLTLATLSQPVPATVKPFPYLKLNLPSFSATAPQYQNKELIVFGKTARAGRGVIGGFIDSSLQVPNDPQGTTRFFTFDYLSAETNAADCYFSPEGGDSGSPSFHMVNGQPALVGTHSAVGATPTGYKMYDTFVPRYITALDALLNPQGYRMRPHDSTATATLALSSTASPSLQRQAMPGSITFIMDNTSSSTTHAAALTLSFAAGQWPSTVTTPNGWLTENLGGGVWSVRKWEMTTSDNAVVTATWSALPVASLLVVNATRESEGFAATASSQSFALAPSYAGWTNGLAASGQEADPDHDGIVNLMEYALGGDPLSGATSTSSGISQLPVIEESSGMISFSFPERSDALQRGLSYLVESSTDLVDAPWSATLPAGSTSSSTPFVPAVAGFVKRSISWPIAGESRRFLRLRVVLNE
ncbi:MAG: hypothetical protein EAZ84_05645 [Verrucomicrobia bacterium]|nr:MAG: hypothetical protein EAZ84_05645 [Verrucomicrobiota bacterium]TAE86957.1 MAG: hypothetical protein EAZ82_09415 [Verrucomicrobiota bacterium]TAF24748.1 MAG: hypothetical protein EAZ71_09640 [Verrucomicrobiota bacterium]